MSYEEYTWAEWENKYKPIKNHLVNDPDQELFETYGEEVEYVDSVEPNRVWTYVQGDSSMIITAGFVYINRIGYYITENPWESLDEYVLVSVDEECKCYNEDGYEDNYGDYGRADCPECEGSGYVTTYID